MLHVWSTACVFSRQNCILCSVAFVRPQARAIFFVYLCFLWFVSLSFLLFITFFTFFFLTQVLSLFVSFLYLFISCSVFPALSHLVSFVIYLPLCLSFHVSSCPGVISFLTLPVPTPTMNVFVTSDRSMDWQTTSPYEGPRRQRTTHNRADARPLGTTGGRIVWRRLEHRDETAAWISTWNTDRRNKKNYS